MSIPKVFLEHELKRNKKFPDFCLDIEKNIPDKI